MSLRTTFSLLTAAVLLIAVLFPHTLPALANFYHTNFSNTENPISEGGKWTNGKADGLDWFDIRTTNGRAYGNQTTGRYTDPTAILKGAWRADQFVTAKVFCTNPTSSKFQEVEIRLRSKISAHSCTGYEVSWRCLTNKYAYTGVARWNGPLGNFTSLDNKHIGVGYGVANGDTVSASITGDLISVYRNEELLFTVRDRTYKTGNPGMGFNFGVGATNADFGFTSFTAVNTRTLGQSRFGERTDDICEFPRSVNWVQAINSWLASPVGAVLDTGPTGNHFRANQIKDSIDDLNPRMYSRALSALRLPAGGK